MKTKFSKRAWSLFLALALVVTAVCGSVTTAKAATSDYTYYYSSEAPETAEAGIEKTFDFTIDKSGALYVDIIFPSPVDVSLCLYDSAGNLVSDPNNPLTLTADSTGWVALDNGTYGFPDEWPSLSAGDYSYGVTAAVDTQYYIDIYSPANVIKLITNCLKWLNSFYEV